MSATATGPSPVRVRTRVEGTVQGVGFRPFVHRIARAEGLAGWVRNDEHGVLLEVEGPPASVERFMARLRRDAPPMAAIDAVASDAVAPAGARGFEILASTRTGDPRAPVAPDWATCPDCLAELTDPGDRRFRYPFINCTNCGPRFTIVDGVPYDRPLTSMAPFAMCPACRREFEEPADRRFHAQPNACPECGPRVRAMTAGGAPAAIGAARDPIGWLADRLADGAIAAVKGLGGYHLVCSARDAEAVSRLRARKHREHRPFALMAPGLDGARELVALTGAQERLLCSGARPIVLATRLPGAAVAGAVAPGAPELGVMLPYSPLHHLLVCDFATAIGSRSAALVMTSGNVSDEPIAYDDEDALERLGAIADLFLVHDRRIVTRTDDSVVRTVSVAGAQQPLVIRRSRGYVPRHLTLPGRDAPPLLACGAEQKNTICVAKGGRAWVSHHIGDLEHLATLRAFQGAIDHLQSLFAVTPALVAHDLHPGYLSTRYALDRADVESIAVQHHHAHLAACLAEHGAVAGAGTGGLGGLSAAVGAIFDGTGYGTDGTVWGGELLVGGLAGCERAGRLATVRMPGGAAAIRQPWRMACAWLSEAFGEPRPVPARLAGQVDPRRWAAMHRIACSAEVSPLTSSIGRLFDAVGALCGLVAEAGYEGHGAVELESAARRAWDGRGGAGGWGEPYSIELASDAGGLLLDPCPAIRRLAGDLEAGVSPDLVAARFHAGLARATVTALARIARARDLETVVLSGGVFQNRLLLESVAAGCEAAGLRVLVPTLLPPNDGGISYGQAAVAAARASVAA
jgi:hydrogenase maturation protein HypF